MIVVTREYDVDNPSGGRRLHSVTRKVFADEDLEGVQKFLDERNRVSGYEWHNLAFNFLKL